MMAPGPIAASRRFAGLTRDAFAPPEFAGKTYKHLARSLYRVRLLVGVSALALVAGFVGPAANPVDTYTLVMFGATLVSMTLLISAVTKGQRELVQRLKESEKQLGVAQELAQVGSWEWDLATDAVTWSDEMFRIYGYQPQEFAVNFRKAMELVVPQDHPRIGKNVEEALQRGVPQTSPIEYRIVRPDGESRVLYGRAQLVFSADGKPIQMVGTVQDITEHKQAQLVLEEAYEREHAAAERLRELDEMKNAFLSAVSHDLRTPLTAILGFAKTVEQRLPILSPEDSIDMVRRISSNAERLKRMLFDLLDLDRLSRGVLTPNRVSTDLAALVCRLVDDLELRDRVIRVEAHPVVATVDPSQVERIVENLLVNAERHTPAGTVIQVRVRPENTNVLIAVDDEGPGISDDEKRVIFERFRQGNGPHAQGSGLGLALVAEFAHLQGGKAWVEDRPGGGSSFRVLLPVDGQPSIAKAS